MYHYIIPEIAGSVSREMREVHNLVTVGFVPSRMGTVSMECSDYTLKIKERRLDSTEHVNILHVFRSCVN